ncbi:tetratricopeptide repeat protein [Halodesulfovibrio aestuarii]|uniref:Tetratricopeptide repeat protein n=1 Tax=Halodesulfovibrio aestuarii TaxID=126333 RepID=A0ABV4JSJ2_9BACT
MKDDSKAAKEHIARAKAYFQRHDILRTTASVIASLRLVLAGKVTGIDRITVDSALKEVLHNMNRVTEVKKMFPRGILYAKGHEKTVHDSLVKLFLELKKIQDSESYNEQRNRKLTLDKALNRGRRYLSSGKLQDATEAFEEAKALYVDEHSMFRMIGEWCLACKQPKMAMKYLKKAVAVDPDTRKAKRILLDAVVATGDKVGAAKLKAQLQEDYSE